MKAEPQEDQLCASLIKQVVKVSDDYLKSKSGQAVEGAAGGGQSRAASVITTSSVNELAALRSVLFKNRSKCNSNNSGRSVSRAASISTGTGTNELAQLRRILFSK